MNDWIKKKTNNKIKNLISADSLDADTRMMLVNAIYFKGLWTYPFDPPYRPFKRPFYINEQDSVEVEFMFTKDPFKHGKFEHLDASAIEFPFKDSNISMLVILPNSRTGLAALESKLQNIDYNELSEKMVFWDINVIFPIFKIEFDIEMNEPLEKVIKLNL